MCQMTSIEEDMHFENSIKNEASEERISQGCSDDRYKRTRTVTPGDSRTYKQTVEHVRLDPKKPCIGKGTMTITSPNSTGKKELSSGKYSVMLGGVIETEMTSEVYSEHKFACNPDRNTPPDIISQTMKMPIPVSIVFEEDFDGSDDLRGRQVILEHHKTDCGPGSPYANMTHGEVDCAFDESIVVSWTLIKRTTECNANLSSTKGNVKINGVLVKNGNIKVGAGDMISTGGKSRIRIAMSDGSILAVGSNSRLILGDPCNLATPTEKKVSEHFKLWLLALDWKIKIALGAPRGFEIRTGKGGAAGGIRGHIAPSKKGYYSLNDNNLEIRSGLCCDFYDKPITVDPEKICLTNELGDLKNFKQAFYLHSDSQGVHDISALKGDIEVENVDGLRKMVVKEGKTVTSWSDGSPFLEIYIRAK